jgi:hypothetical protein
MRACSRHRLCLPLLLLLLLLLLLSSHGAHGGGSRGQHHRGSSPTAIRARPVLRILPVGDSTTYAAQPVRGAGVPGALPTYRLALWQLLRRQQRLRVEFVGSRGAHGAMRGREVIPGAHPEGRRHEGFDDWRVDQLASGLSGRLDNAYLELNVDVAIVWAGIQDLKEGKRPELLIAEFTRLVTALRERPRSNTTTLVCTLPALLLPDQPGMYTGREVRDKINAFNEALPSWAAQIEAQLLR